MSDQHRKNTGLPPGSLVFTGEKRIDQSCVHILNYDGEQLSEQQFPESVPHKIPSQGVTWYDLRGIHDVELIRKIGQEFGIHSLILEDILDIQQRPKYEEYQQGIFLTAKALYTDPASGEIRQEHISIYFSDNFLFSFQEDDDDLFLRVRERLKSPIGKFRLRKTDYLAYALLDTLVDSYYLVLDNLDSKARLLEKKILENASDALKISLYEIRNDLLLLRKQLIPLREAVHLFSKSESLLIEENTKLFLRDLFDHTLQITDTLDTQRDLVNGLRDLYLSEISYRMNKVMQLLTIISTIFIPLTFLVGVYGMNFRHMPELSYRYGYFYLWILMGIIAILMMIYFRRKKWL